MEALQLLQKGTSQDKVTLKSEETEPVFPVVIELHLSSENKVGWSISLSVEHSTK